MESDAAFVPLLVSLLDQHSRSPAIVIRTAFVLGNLTTSREACRDALAAVPGVAGQLAGLLAGYALQGAEALAQGAKVRRCVRLAVGYLLCHVCPAGQAKATCLSSLRKCVPR